MTQVYGQMASPAYTDGMTRAMLEGQDSMAKAPERINNQMQAATEAARGVSSEMLNYAGQRLRAHAEHLQRLARCQTPQNVMEQQMAFMQSSIQQYSQGVAKLFDTAKQQQGMTGRQQS